MTLQTDDKWRVGSFNAFNHTIGCFCGYYKSICNPVDGLVVIGIRTDFTCGEEGVKKRILPNMNGV
jgi:hypothetical protein